MHLVENAGLVKRRVRLAAILHFGSLLAFGIGFIVSLQVPEYWVYPYLAILVGLVLYQFAQTGLRRYGPRHRLDGALARALKGLDDRHTLVAFAAPTLPDYILIGPSGVTALIARSNGGNVVCRSDRWSIQGGNLLLRIFRTPLGNPSVDARNAIAQVKSQLAEDSPRDGEDPVGAVIVFLNPGAHLRIDGCSFPVTTGKELRHHLRRVKGSLTPTQVARLRRKLVLFEPG